MVGNLHICYVASKALLMKEMKTLCLYDLIFFSKTEEADNAPEKKLLSVLLSSSKVAVLPDYRYISLSEEFSCHFNELKQYRTATILFAP